MDPIIKTQLVKFYTNMVELNLLRKSNQKKMIFLLTAFESGSLPSLKQLPLQIEEKDIQKSLRFADRQFEEVLKLINQKAYTGTNKYKLRKLVIESTNQVTERIIDRNKAGLNKLMASYNVDQLHTNFSKAKVTPGEIQNQSKMQMSEVVKILAQQLEEVLSYKISLRGICLNLPLSNSISCDKITLKYTFSDFLIYKKKLCQIQRLTLLEKLNDLEEASFVNEYTNKSFIKKIGRKKVVSDKHLKQALVQQIKHLETTENKITKKLIQTHFKSGEIPEKKKAEIKEIQKKIQVFKLDHSKKVPLSKKVSRAKYISKEGYQGSIKVPTNFLSRDSLVCR